MKKQNEIVAHRIAACRACPELSRLNTCAQCGCFMPVKVRFKWMKCPLGKWGSVEQASEQSVSPAVEVDHYQ